MMRGYYGGNGDYGYGNMMGGGGGILMFFFGVLVLVGILLLVMWAMRASHGGQGPMMMHSGHVPPANGPAAPQGAAGHHEAIAIAKRRLASGEITPEQYQEIIKTLGD